MDRFNHINTTNVIGILCKLFDSRKIGKNIDCIFRCQYQGMAPAKPRDERYFDAGTKLHVAFDLSYIKYNTSISIK